jgi:type VI secretion system secreted protein VgrG
LFSFQLDLLSENSSIDFDDVVGQPITISVELEEGGSRYFNGLVSRFVQLPNAGRFARYQAEIVPWLWFLTRTTDCFIFQNKSVPDIVQEVFKKFGFNDFELSLQGSYDPWEYCVQYRETACNFVMRLLEQEGIFFFFRHEEDKHVLVLGDSPSAHKDCPTRSRIEYAAHGASSGAQSEDVITHWQCEQELRAGSYTINDYNFEMPSTTLLSTVNGRISQGGNNRFEIYDFPGEYEKRGEGDSYAKKRIEEEEAPHLIGSGTSTCRYLAAGFKFELQGFDRRDQNGNYVLTSVSHSGHIGGSYETGQQGDVHYSNIFKCIPAAVPFRPLRITPKPLMQGCQTAMVTGSSGEEIYTDKYGRVKVQFHWDREGKYNENSSCWVRVSQNWAGKKWGAVFLPRVGQEVIVDFLEGDPDRPIITGRVYNGSSMPPYKLPDEKTKSTIKSYSSKGGGGFNEFRFEDKKGSEQIFIHAEKDQDIRIKNDLMEWVGNDSHLIVKHDQIEKVEGDKHLAVSGDKNEKVDGTVSLKVGTDHQNKIGSKYALDAGMEVHLKAGTNMVLEAGATLTLKVGGNFININSGGIFVKGTMVFINSGGAAGSGSGASPEAPKDPKEAADAEAGEAAEQLQAKTPHKPASYSPAALVLQHAAQSGMPFCDLSSEE